MQLGHSDGAFVFAGLQAAERAERIRGRFHLGARPVEPGLGLCRRFLAPFAAVHFLRAPRDGHPIAGREAAGVGVQGVGTGRGELLAEQPIADHAGRDLKLLHPRRLQKLVEAVPRDRNAVPGHHRFELLNIRRGRIAREHVGELHLAFVRQQKDFAVHAPFARGAVFVHEFLHAAHSEKMPEANADNLRATATVSKWIRAAVLPPPEIIARFVPSFVVV